MSAVGSFWEADAGGHDYLQRDPGRRFRFGILAY
jgi:hypothetical protein